MNAPDRFASYVLEDGEKRLVFRPDERIPNAGTFVCAKETHTAGDILRMQILRNPAVLFCGYQMPHPLLNEMLIKIQTDGTIPPMEALKVAIEDLESEIDTFDRKFRDSLAEVRAFQAAEELRAKAAAAANGGEPDPGAPAMR